MVSVEGLSARQEKFAIWPGRIVTLAGIWVLLSFPLRMFSWTWTVDYAFSLLNVPAEPNLFIAAALLLLGSALRRRLRAAFILLLIYQICATVLDTITALVGLAYWDQPEQADLDLSRTEIVLTAVAVPIGLVVTVLVWRARRAFPARLAHASRRTALILLVAGLAAAWSLAFSLTWLFPDSLHGMGERVIWANRSALGLSAAGDNAGLHGHHGHHWVSVAASTVSALVLLGTVAVFLRSARSQQYLTAEAELQLRRLILESGDRDSLGYFATRRDKSVIFSPDGRAAVTYRVVAAVSLASADPIGHVGSWPAAIGAWRAEAHRHGWFTAALSASEAGANAYVESGLKALSIGDEAILEVSGFDLQSRAMRPVRRAVTRVRAAGYTGQVRRQAAIGADELAELDRLAAAWRGDGSERGFSMALGRFGDPADGRCVVVTAHDPQGRVRGVLTFAPWGVRGLSLDLMRADRQAENGLTEFMVAVLVEACPDLGVRRISLNFAMFRSVFSSADMVGAGPVTRLSDAVLSVASRFWQLESLYRANAKYLPNWLPRFLCFDSSLTLSRAVLAAGIAEGFLPSLSPAATALDADPAFLQQIRDQEDQLLRPAVPLRRLSQQQRARLDKRARLAEAYPVTVPRTVTLAEARTLPAGTGVSVTGRVRALRDLGGVLFAVLQEGDATLQAMLTADRTPDQERLRWRRTVDLGDHVSVTGAIGSSRSGELSVLADTWVMAAKCLRPLPDVHAGFTDPEARLGQRYLDLLVNPDAMQVLRHRSAAVRALRQAFAVRGFTEVETPMLQAVHGGASARPFRTHINAYDMELYLRIAPELYLKRLCVAGMEKVFELNRNFRNEGADATHNPEFTSLEAYQAYADYHTMRHLTRELILEVATAVHGRPVALRPEGPVDLGEPWPVLTVHEAVSKAAGASLTADTPVDEVRQVCARHGVHAKADATAGELVVELYDALVEKQTTYPTFYTDFPLETSPLTRTHRGDPRLAERWDLVAFGMELGTAYSELVDPIDQRDRLTAQSLKAAAGDPEAMQIDESFLTALEYAMPPTGGLGLGVDRLVMLLTGTAIRATLAFPFHRQARP
ncbi:lysyl-tRNA synthetase [Actinoplanes sp. SE50]|uniref:bifunctional lysylphosphatidylglycerol synthetase/lysine--tRNA ligase LysX n=1 Tax=unclassified Actinoplanes TaxID=2626549 RepID=UPI00023EC5F2|nr:MULTISPECIES: bifunctional lysylphosphatidylglycerol synthetase/lysine--tRNA ligase LysX [unclassified Actinoplanes]AEV84163.1 lysyl-tRNA synthetase [Actinoplanes sp. SE50/110]ATO82555.1 lysyl-tRNA synthetase [Actinoplanes sp. SE50]SLL99962.1 lysine--tRNA ligase [Actinoplanes sp. SE50/110]